jgi:hypothetical protein
MRLISRIIVGTLIAFTWTSLASAETTTTQSSIEPGEFAHATEMRLDDEFEKTVSRASEVVLSGLSGPSSMNCSHAVTMTELETCVVTAEGMPRLAAPAALAQHRSVR